MRHMDRLYLDFSLTIDPIRLDSSVGGNAAMNSSDTAKAMFSVTLIDLLSAIQDSARSDREVVATLASLLRRRLVRSDQAAA